MNLTILKGNLGNDPEVKQLANGKVCKFNLATSESYKDKEGNRVTKTEWHRIVFFGTVCDVLKEYFRKGDQIIVTGKIKYGSYENKDGDTIYTTDIVCDTFDFCGKSERESPKDNQGEWRGKKPVASMSKVEELPGYVDTGDVPDDPNLPF